MHANPLLWKKKEKKRAASEQKECCNEQKIYMENEEL